MSHTFGSKLDQMRKDLATIVDKMNRDRSSNVAMKAQQALVAIEELEDEPYSLNFDELDWDWEPQP